MLLAKMSNSKSRDGHGKQTKQEPLVFAVRSELEPHFGGKETWVCLATKSQKASFTPWEDGRCILADPLILKNLEYPFTRCILADPYDLPPTLPKNKKRIKNSEYWRWVGKDLRKRSWKNCCFVWWKIIIIKISACKEVLFGKGSHYIFSPLYRGSSSSPSTLSPAYIVTLSAPLFRCP